MPIPLAGPGQGLPLPQNLFPTQLTNAPADISTNRLALSPGDSFVLPAGDWWITMGSYLILQYLDPVTNTWSIPAGAPWTRGMSFITADGFTCRIANLTGCVVSASIMNGGTNYVQATTTLTVIGSFQTGVAVPTLLPIVGGAVGLSTGTFSLYIPTAGNGYGIAPIIVIPPPPPAQANANGVGGIQAEAIAILGSGGSLSSVSMINAGAGYPTAPIGVVVPSPFDPNLATGITNASVLFSLVSAGAITGALVTNNGGPLINGSLASVTISVGGAGASGSLTANVMQTIITASISTVSTGFSGVGIIATGGGGPLQGSITNSLNFQLLEFEPRPANITGTLGTLGNGVIYDGGLFESAPAVFPLPGAGATNTVGIITPTMGSRPDVAHIQPAP